MTQLTITGKYRAITKNGMEYYIVLSDGTEYPVSYSTFQKKQIGGKWIMLFATTVKPTSNK